MRPADRSPLSLAIAAATPAAALLPTAVWAQVPASDVPGAAPPGQVAGDLAGALPALIVTLGVVALIALGVKVFDLKRRRDEEAVHLQARIADALLADPALAGLLITPTARVPFWRGSPVTIELAGQVPTLALREVALRLAKREASGMRLDFRIEDRTAMIGPRARRAA